MVRQRDEKNGQKRAPKGIAVSEPLNVFIILWFVLQLVQGYLSLGMIAEGAGGVAWFAHIGGFLAGLVFIRVLYTKPKARRRRLAR